MDNVIMLLMIGLLVLLASYPTYLVWCFLTLGIKAFKKYLRDETYYVVDVTDHAEE